MVSLSSSSTLLAVALIAMLSKGTHAVDYYVNWILPQVTGTVFESREVNVGDTLTFAWNVGTHDVWIYPSTTCDTTGGIQVGNYQNNPTIYEFTAEEAGTTITFACDIGAHCQAGMFMNVAVLNNGVTNGTPAPSAVSTEGGFSECFVCGDEESRVTQPDSIVSLPVPGEPPFEVSCENLYNDGLNGIIPDNSCAFIADASAVTCGCAPVDSDFTCSVCGEGFIINLPDTEITVDEAGESTTCGQLEDSGFNGDLTPAECVAAEAFNRATNPCDCVPVDGYQECLVCGNNETMPMTPDYNISLSADFTTTCGALVEAGKNKELGPGQCAAAQGEAYFSCNCAPADFTCSVCGGDGTNVTMMSPENNFTVPGGFVVNCGELDAAGVDGTINPNDCDLLSPFVVAECGCAPVGYTCNICGEGSAESQGVTEGTATFIPGEDTTCSEAQAEGLAGGIPPLRCAAITPFAQVVCGCMEGGTVPPTAAAVVTTEPSAADTTPVEETEGTLATASTGTPTVSPVAATVDTTGTASTETTDTTGTASTETTDTTGTASTETMDTTGTASTDTTDTTGTSATETMDTTETSATDATNPDIVIVPPSQSATVTGLEGKEAASGSVAVSTSMVMTISCLMGMVVAALIV